jgi:capsular exopolysaccharide synthesis family protein
MDAQGRPGIAASCQIGHRRHDRHHRMMKFGPLARSSLLPVHADHLEGDELDLRDYFGILRRRWRWVAASVLLCTVPSLALSLAVSPTYQASTEVLVSVRSAGSLFVEDGFGSSADSERALNNELEIIGSSSTGDSVLREYDGPIEIRRGTIRARPAGDGSDAIRISVVGPDPEAVADLANFFTTAYIELSTERRVDDLLGVSQEIQERIAELQSNIDNADELLGPVDAQLAQDPTNPELLDQREEIVDVIESETRVIRGQLDFYRQQYENLQFTAGLTQSGGVRLLSAATVPQRPVSPQPIRNAVFALVIGGLIGVALAFLRDRLDDTVRNAEDLDRLAQGEVPTLGLIPALDLGGGLAVQDDPRGSTAEAYRTLRTAVRFAGLDRKLRVIQVTSSSLGEGKTTTVANLAIVMAQAGQKVAVVCCDLRRPRVHELFGQSLSPGFTDILLGEATLSQALRHLGQNLYLLPAGGRPPNPSELLQTTRAESMISALAAEFDYVLVDSTPILPVTDGLVVSHAADATLLVIDAGGTTRDRLRQTLALLRQADAPLIGFVLNRATSGGSGSSDAYTYAYASEEESEARGRRFRMPLPRPKITADA